MQRCLSGLASTARHLAGAPSPSSNNFLSGFRPVQTLSKIGRKLQQSIEARASGAGGKPSGGSKSSRARAPPPPPKKQIDRNGTVVNHAPTAAGPKTSPAARITGSTSRRSNRIASVIPEGLIPSYNYEDDGEDDFNRGPTAAASSSSEEVKPKKGITFNTKIRTAKYVSSAVDLASCPPARPDMPEFAVIGRSNVGKSSLINFLTGVNDLAKVSKTPGKTRTINHFVINDDWYLVDLPGYGYAKMSSEKVLEWNRFTSTFFKERPTLANVFLLVDSSIPPQQLDLDVANWFGESQIPFSIVFTKMDKKKKGEVSNEDNIEAFKTELLKTWETLPEVLITSAEKSIGRQAVLKHISELRSFFVETAENDPNFMQSVINSRRAMRDEPTNGPRGSVMDE